MEYLVGLILGLVAVGSATATGMDRDRAFYPTVLIVVAFYYVLFGVMGGSGRALGIEIAFACAFSLLACVGFTKNLWLVAAALAGHGVFDVVHHWFIDDPGVPLWWPGFCFSCDLILGAGLGIRLTRNSRRA